MAEEQLRSPQDVQPDADSHVGVEGHVTTSPEVRTIGTIEGKIEGLMVHGKNHVVLYDRSTGLQVICCFRNAVSWKALRDVFGKRTAVTGEIRSRRSGGRVSIDVSSYYVFPPEHELPSAHEVRGLLRNVE